MESPLVQKLKDEGYDLEYTKANRLNARKGNISVRALDGAGLYFGIYVKAENNKYYKIGLVRNSGVGVFDKMITAYNDKKQKFTSVKSHLFLEVSYTKIYNQDNESNCVYKRRVVINQIDKIKPVILEGWVISDNIGKPNQKIWFHLACKGVKGEVFEIITDCYTENNQTAVFYPIRNGGIVPLSAYNKTYLSQMNSDDREFIKVAIGDYMAQVQK